MFLSFEMIGKTWMLHEVKRIEVVLVPDSGSMPLVARGNPDDTTVIVALVVEEGRAMESDSEVELQVVYPQAA